MRSHRRAIRCLLGASVIVVGLGTSHAMAQEAAMGSVANGRQIYYDQACYACHGFNGVAAERITVLRETGRRDLVGTNSPVLANAQAFTRFLRMRADVAPLLPSTRMPHYPESELSDRDAGDLFAYIKSFRLDAPDVEEVPVLQQILKSAERPNAMDSPKGKTESSTR